MPLIWAGRCCRPSRSISSCGNDLADRFLDVGEKRGGFFHARADRRAHVHQDLAGVDLGEEVAAEQTAAAGTTRTTKARKPATKTLRCSIASVEQIMVAGTHTARNALRNRAGNAPADCAMRRASITLPWSSTCGRMLFAAGISPSSAPGCARGRTRKSSRRSPLRPSARTGSARRRSRKNIGTNTMQIHSSETKAGVDDLRGAVHDRGLHFLAVLQMPVDVFDRHRSVVDQDADREREPAERHDVQRLAHRRQRDDGAENRQAEWTPAMIRVERQLPRNSRIIRLVSAAAMTPSAPRR